MTHCVVWSMVSSVNGISNCTFLCDCYIDEGKYFSEGRARGEHSGNTNDWTVRGPRKQLRRQFDGLSDAILPSVVRRT